jgi:predicted alpha/beta superfamily hydrolase
VRRSWLRLAAATVLLLTSNLVHPHPSRHQSPHTLTGDIRVHQNFHSQFLTTDRNIIVYLPPDYATHQRKHYPVLYLHDGQNLFDGATSYIPGQEWHVDETAQRLITSGQIKPLIIVGIYNAGIERVNEYTPTRDSNVKAGGKADLYGRMIVEELIPFVNQHYRTRRGAADTGLGGSSLGGLVTLHLGLKYPHVFGRLAVVSPSVWWDGREIIGEVDQLKHKTHARIWLDIGTEEGRNSVPDVRLLRDALIAKGWRLNKDLAYMEAQGARHNEAAWAARVEPILKFLFPENRNSEAGIQNSE